MAAAFKKKRFLQKSLEDLFKNKTPLPDGMTIHFPNTELARLNKKYSSQFKDLLGVKNTSDVVRTGLAQNRTRAALLLGQEPPKREREEGGEFSYIDENHIGHGDDPYYGILDEDGDNMNALFGEKIKREDDGDFDLEEVLKRFYGDGPSPVSSRTRAAIREKKMQTGKGKKQNKEGENLSLL